MKINDKIPMVRCIARIVVHSEEYTLFEIKIMHHNFRFKITVSCYRKN